MSDHLSISILNALADGELSVEQLVLANHHLGGCPTCTSSALYQSLLKAATAKAGQRYKPPPQLQERLMRQISEAGSRPDASRLDSPIVSRPSRASRYGLLGWATAAVLLLLCGSMVLVQRARHRAEMASAEHAALVTEVFDQHIGTLAASEPPQVISSDRHTVKPWFQGKLPFSFNLPDNLPQDTTLDGANLTYLHNQPVAQLLYSIGRHRVSIFLRERIAGEGVNQSSAEHSGFHVMDFSTDALEIVGVSDVDPVRLTELMGAIRQRQTGSQPQSR
jgi:anti-sigma factor RsiW